MRLLERRIESGDRTLVVLEGGDVAGVPVLVHHGTPGSGLLYRPHLEDALARGIRLIGYGRPGWLAGMGEDNVQEFTAALAGAQALEPLLRGLATEMLGADAETIAEALRSLLSAADAAALTGELADFFVESTRVGLSAGVAGWLDDDLAFTKPWGFSPAEIRVPVLLWQGVQDRFVPLAHGRWLAERIPGVEAHLSEEDGHLTLVDRAPEVHAWLLERLR